MVDPGELEATLDLWASRWDASERARVEAALVRAMLGEAGPRHRATALAACYLIATPRLLDAVRRARSTAELSDAEVAWADRAMADRRALLQLAEQVAGEEEVLDFFLRHSDNHFADQLLERVDLRHLLIAGRRATDPALRAEVARRIAARGPYQRRRLARALGLSLGQLDRAAGSDEPPYYENYELGDGRA